MFGTIADLSMIRRTWCRSLSLVGKFNLYLEAEDTNRSLLDTRSSLILEELLELEELEELLELEELEELLKLYN